MTDRYEVSTKVLKVQKEILRFSHPGHALTLAMLITGGNIWNIKYPIFSD